MVPRSRACSSMAPLGGQKLTICAELQRSATRLKLPEADWQRGRVVDAEPGVKRDLYREP